MHPAAALTSITLLTPLEPVCAASSTISIHSKISFISKGISFLLLISAISGSDDDAAKFLYLIQATQMQLSTKYTRYLKLDPEVEK